MKCNYCDFVWEDEEEYGKHLNATHTKCFHCSTVFNNDEFDDDYAICGKCREKKNEDQIAKEIAKMSDGEVVQNVEKYFPKWTATESMKRMLTKYGRLDEQVYFLEILRLESLCRRAAEEIKVLDDKLQEISPDPDGTHTSVNLLSRLDGRIGGWYTMAEPNEEG